MSQWQGRSLVLKFSSLQPGCQSLVAVSRPFGYVLGHFFCLNESLTLDSGLKLKSKVAHNSSIKPYFDVVSGLKTKLASKAGLTPELNWSNLF